MLESIGGLYKWGKDVSGDTCKESEDWRYLFFCLKKKKWEELTLFETNWPMLKQIDLVLEWIYFRFKLIMTLNIYIMNILDFLCFFLFYLL